MTTSPTIRFLKKVNTCGPLPDQRSPHYKGMNRCWNWTAAKNEDGYGYFGLNRRVLKAHRASHILFVGPIPDGMNVMHRCDNPACVNPEHLRIGTQRDNVKDACLKGRSSGGSGVNHWTYTHPERRLYGDLNPSRTHPDRLRRGESAGRSKLTELQVRQIRNDYAAGGVTYESLGQRYGVTKAAIRFIVNRKTWAHIN